MIQFVILFTALLSFPEERPHSARESVAAFVRAADRGDRDDIRKTYTALCPIVAEAIPHLLGALTRKEKVCHRFFATHVPRAGASTGARRPGQGLAARCTAIRASLSRLTASPGVLLDGAMEDVVDALLNPSLLVECEPPLSGPGAASVCLAALEEERWLRVWGTVGLGEKTVPGEVAIPVLMRIVRQRRPRLEAVAKTALARRGREVVLPILAEIAKFESPDDYYESHTWIEALGLVGPEAAGAVDVLVNRIRAIPPDRMGRKPAIQALLRIGPTGRPLLGSLLEAIADEWATLNLVYCGICGRYCGRNYGPAGWEREAILPFVRAEPCVLLAALGHESPRLRAVAAEVVGELFKAEVNTLHAAAMRALDRIFPEESEDSDDEAMEPQNAQEEHPAPQILEPRPRRRRRFE